MKKIILLAMTALTLLPAMMSAQENDSIFEKESDFKAYVQADIISHYLWRGSDLGGVSIQPEAGISWKGLSLAAFGNAGIDKEDVREFDITLGYSYKGFNIGVTDYWSSGIDSEDRYFYFKEGYTAHQLEGNLGYTCKYFSLQAYTMFWGNDYKISGKRAYSTYIEVSAPFRACGLDWDARVGITPMESAGHAIVRTIPGLLKDITVIDKSYTYGEGFTCNNVSLRATKNIGFKDLRMPVFAEIVANPYLQKAYFIVGLSIATL